MKKIQIFIVTFIVLGVGSIILSDRLNSLTNSTTNEISIEDNRPLPGDEYITVREEMVDSQIKARGITNLAVLSAMRSVPRHEFVLDQYLSRAYTDQPLPINHGQTISQPYIVALMSELLDIQEGQRVLEIGTGSGYQAAVLAELGVEVYTVEIIPELAEEARERLNRLGYTKIHTKTADGYFGWEENGPFEAIIVTAAPDHLPQPLVNQLAESGRLLIPIGPVGAFQTLWQFEKIDGDLQATNMGGVRFVPLTGDH
ncbi:protein-L-isoaspartate(D-aspartate) O-methyltransferase [Chloroflexota bacterium]